MRSIKLLFVLLLSFVFVSGCAHRVSGVATEQNQIELKTLNFQLSESKFSVPTRDIEFMSNSGLSDGSYYIEFRNVANQIFSANGITVSSDGNAPYRMTVVPKQLKITQQVSGGTFRSFDAEFKLYRAGESKPLWAATRFIDISTKQSKFYKTQMGNTIMAILNGLNDDRVIRLPKPNAVTPKGNANYMND